LAPKAECVPTCSLKKSSIYKKKLTKTTNLLGTLGKKIFHHPKGVVVFLSEIPTSSPRLAASDEVLQTSSEMPKSPGIALTESFGNQQPSAESKKTC